MTQATTPSSLLSRASLKQRDAFPCIYQTGLSLRAGSQLVGLVEEGLLSPDLARSLLRELPTAPIHTGAALSDRVQRLKP